MNNLGRKPSEKGSKNKIRILQTYILGPASGLAPSFSQVSLGSQDRMLSVNWHPKPVNWLLLATIGNFSNKMSINSTGSLCQSTCWRLTGVGKRSRELSDDCGPQQLTGWSTIQLLCVPKSSPNTLKSF